MEEVQSEALEVGKKKCHFYLLLLCGVGLGQMTCNILVKCYVTEGRPVHLANTQRGFRGELTSSATGLPSSRNWIHLSQALNGACFLQRVVAPGLVKRWRDFSDLYFLKTKLKVCQLRPFHFKPSYLIFSVSFENLLFLQPVELGFPVSCHQPATATFESN